MNAAHRSSSVVGCIVAGSLTLTLSACGGDNEGQAAAPSTTEAGEPVTAATEPTTTELAPTASVPVTTTADHSPPATTEPESTATTVPAEPVPVREFMYLTAGWSYATQNFSLPLTFTIPPEDEDGRWRLLFDTDRYTIVTLSQSNRPEPGVEREEPGFSLYAVPDGVGPDGFVEAWTAYAAEREAFTADVSDGVYLGSPAIVISGTYELDSPQGGAYFLQLGDSMRVPTASGERTYLVYVVPVGDSTLVVSSSGHELDFDMNVTMVNQIVDTIEFVEAGT